MHSNDPPRLPKEPAARLLLCAVLLSCAAAPVRAGWVDTLFGQGIGRAESEHATAKQRVWRIGEFTMIELVPREPGPGDNQHPVSVQSDALRQRLALVQASIQGKEQSLFAPQELAELVAPLGQALGRAGPGDDILLLSSSRREAGILGAPTAVTARLFVQGGSLQFIVHDARYDFHDAYRGANVAPRFTYGTRASPSTVAIQSNGATTQRADWLSIPLNASAAGPASGAHPSAAAPLQPASASSVRKGFDAADADNIERRLESLKRLREKGLITEDEYQHKRREILQLL